MQALQDFERGKIVNRIRAQQQIDFSGIRIPGTRITPTDLDGVIEYHDKLWVGIEIKYAGEEVQPGQRIAFERMAHDLNAAGKSVLFLIADHHTDAVTEDVDAGAAKVRAFTSSGKRWRYPAEEGWSTTVKELIEDFLAYME